jgi:drug/metabolite transporter (DMT)-like permease
MVLIGSSTAMAAKSAVADLPVEFVPIVRFGGAGLVLLPLVWGRGSFLRLWKEDAFALILASLFCVPINQAFFLNASRLAPTTHVGLIYATCPLVVLTLAVSLRHERLATARVLGIATSVFGAAIIALGTLTQKHSAKSGALLGDLLLIGAVVSWGAYLAVNKRLIVRHSALVVLAATFLLGAFVSMLMAIPSMTQWPARLASTRPVAWCSLAYLTLVASLLGLACQNLALRRFDASHVANVGNLSPVLTVVWGVLLLGESITLSLVLGGVLTLAGIFIAGQKAVGRLSGSVVTGPACSGPQNAA